MFATEHDFDRATQLFARQVARPLSADENGRPAALWSRAGFTLDAVIGQSSTRSVLADVLCGQSQACPALLVSGTHGVECPIDDPRQFDVQGAIVCQDWAGYGAIKPEHWFAASDIPADAKLHGMIHFFFACYGGGCPEFDNYERVSKEPRRIAKKPFFSRLPQAMLSHPNGGALAVFAHVDRAWAYSFEGQRGGPQVQGFREVIGRLLRGQRVGQATDMFNVRWAAISTELSELQGDVMHGADVPTRTLGNLWVSRDDARNYMIFGDPAVRLRVEDMAH